MLNPHLTLNCSGKILSLHQPVVMGILNVTPDSFYDGGKYQNEKAVLNQVEKMLQDGAAIIDIGGMSSRPGAEIISEKEELNRVIPHLINIQKEFPDAIVSIDTINSKIAKAAIENGASLVNDISSGRIDEKMFETVAELGVPYVLMHMQGKPKDMQKNPNYENVIQEILDFFIKEIDKLQNLGIKDIVLDVGFGFGKTVQHNYQILKNLHVFKMLEYPILAGISRKSMIHKVLDITPKEALNGTTALHMVALQEGAKILRVHDVKEAVEVVKLHDVLVENEKD
jgi:dihydropteroate synthase